MIGPDANNTEFHKSKSDTGDEAYGKLYVVSTPIGNLEDITLRALGVLKRVSLIAAENVKHTRGLCEHYGIKKRLTSYHQHNQRSKTPELVSTIKSGKDVALVTDAGTPGISDPGALLTRQAVREGIKLVPIPGASAVISALSVSGLPAERFVFLGFLPPRLGKRRKALKELITEPRTMVFFEAPHRLKAMLTDIVEILGDRQMVMVREMTKLFEEVIRGPVSEVLSYLTPGRIRGEFTLVLAGNEKEKVEVLNDQVIERMERMLAVENMSVKEIAHVISDEKKLAYRRVYKECLARKKVLGI
jgi:16S rRNA (cytidine1402-2'-O)-methyltransferase